MSALMSRVNGQVMQDSNTSDLIFSCRELIAYLSDAMTLLPGTVIMTGTPSGRGLCAQAAGVSAARRRGGDRDRGHRHV